MVHRGCKPLVRGDFSGGACRRATLPRLFESPCNWFWIHPKLPWETIALCWKPCRTFDGNNPKPCSHPTTSFLAAVKMTLCPGTGAKHASAGKFRTSVQHQNSHRGMAQAAVSIMLCAQAARVLSRPLLAGGHPLRALRTGLARPPRPAHAWARISCHADPVGTQWIATTVWDPGAWQWAPLPANCAHTILEAGGLRLVTRLVELAGAHVRRCASPSRPSAPDTVVPWERNASASLLPCRLPHAHPTVDRKCQQTNKT